MSVLPPLPVCMRTHKPTVMVNADGYYGSCSCGWQSLIYPVNGGEDLALKAERMHIEAMIEERAIYDRENPNWAEKREEQARAAGLYS